MPEKSITISPRKEVPHLRHDGNMFLHACGIKRRRLTYSGGYQAAQAVSQLTSLLWDPIGEASGTGCCSTNECDAFSDRRPGWDPLEQLDGSVVSPICFGDLCSNRHLCPPSYDTFVEVIQSVLHTAPGLQLFSEIAFQTERSPTCIASRVKQQFSTRLRVSLPSELSSGFPSSPLIIRVPFFLLSVLIGEPKKKKGKRVLLENLVIESGLISDAPNSGCISKPCNLPNP